MKQGIPKPVAAILMSALLNLMTIGCSSDVTVAPESDSATPARSGRSTTDHSIRFVGEVLEIDIDARAIQFRNMPERVLVSANATVQPAGPQPIGPELILKSIEVGMYIDAKGEYSDRETIVLSSLVLVGSDRYHSGAERTPEQ